MFLSAHYWRLFEHLETPPRVVVDLGSNCGHFAVLLHLLIREKFGSDEAQYFLFEPVANLIPGIRRTLQEVGLHTRAEVVNAAVGKRSGNASISVNPQNMLTTSVAADGDSGSGSVPYVDPLTVIPDQVAIDVLKVDIEGSEYDLFDHCPELFSRARLLAMELHGAAERQQGLLQELAGTGLVQKSESIRYDSARMLILSRESDSESVGG